MPINPVGNGSNVVVHVTPASIDLYTPIFGDPVLKSIATTTITEGFSQFTAMEGENWLLVLGEICTFAMVILHPLMG